MGRMLIIQLSLETHSRHVGRIVARIEAEVGSPLREIAHFSALPCDPQHQGRPQLRIPS